MNKYTRGHFLTNLSPVKCRESRNNTTNLGNKITVNLQDDSLKFALEYNSKKRVDKQGIISGIIVGGEIRSLP